MSFWNFLDIDVLIGETITKIDGMEKGSDEIHFYTDDGKHYKMYHEQNCCESVWLEDVYGNVEDLIGSPIFKAEERISDEKIEDADEDCYQDDSFTWTFYTLATIKGYVDLRWFGESNGYYSESVDFEEVEY